MDKIKPIFINQEFQEKMILTIRQSNLKLNAIKASSIPPVEPPKDLREFEDRIGEIEMKLSSLIFGLGHDFGFTKTLKREKSPEVIVEVLRTYDKYSQKGPYIVVEPITLPLKLFQLVIEQDVPFVVCDDIYLLGVKRDRSGISLSQKRKITAQAAAQVLWFVKKDEIASIEDMKKVLLDIKNPLCRFFQLDRFLSENESCSRKDESDSRAIENYVREVFPVPVDLRKGRPPKNVPHKHRHHFNNLIYIPGIFLENEKVVNFQKLRFAIFCINKALEILGWSTDQIDQSELIRHYKSSLKFPANLFISDWILKDTSDIFS